MTYTFNTFTNKQEYLTARQEWKTEYANLSDAIRATKLGIKNAMREGQPAWRLQSEYAKQRKLANEMLEALETAKATAQAQYLKEKENASVLM